MSAIQPPNLILCRISQYNLWNDSQAVIENDDVLAPVGHLCILECHTEDKDTHDSSLPIRPVCPLLNPRLLNPRLLNPRLFILYVAISVFE